MQPKAYEVLVAYEQNKRATIAVQIAELTRQWDESWVTQQNLEVPSGESAL